MNSNAKRIWAVVAACVSCGMIMLVIGLCTTNSSLSTQEQPGNQQKVEQAVRMLWSSDDTLRRRGRDQVLQIGPAAATALRDMLTDLIRDRRPRFALETEAEGERALNAYMDLVRGKRESVDNDEEFQTVSQLAINSRLSSDAISLLGELRAAEGVPILIRIMERKGAISSEPTGVELEALRKIGSPAVPSLIKSIENARITASTAIFERPIDFGFSIQTDSTLGLEGTDGEGPAIEEQDQIVLDPEEIWEMEKEAFTIKRNAIQVLGDFRDETALPFLEGLLKAEDNKDWTVVPSLVAAIGRIKGQPTSGYPASAEKTR